MKDNLRRIILRILYWPIIWIGKIELPKRKITSYDLYKLKDLLPGDVLLSRQEWSLSNLLIPGFWKHGAMYIGEKGGVHYVIEATANGVMLNPLIDFCLTKDYILVRRPLFANHSEMSTAVALSITVLGAKYDYMFNRGNNEFYCFELIHWAYENEGSPFELRETMGVLTVTGDDIANTRKFKTIYDSRDISI